MRSESARRSNPCADLAILPDIRYIDARAVAATYNPQRAPRYLRVASCQVLRYGGSMKGQPAIELSDNDLTLLIEACQGQASRYAQDADYERKPVIRQALLAGAAELERLAERLRAIIERNAREAPEDVVTQDEQNSDLPSNVQRLRPKGTTS